MSVMIELRPTFILTFSTCVGEIRPSVPLISNLSASCSSTAMRDSGLPFGASMRSI
jgi:hypothetical protein